MTALGFLVRELLTWRGDPCLPFVTADMTDGCIHLQYNRSWKFHHLTAALERKNAENLKQIFPEKEYRGLSPNFHIHVSVSELYIPTMKLPFLLEEICGPILGIYKSLTDT
jgi:hypothetical protein